LTPRRIARRYAKALFRIARAEGKVEEYLRELEIFRGLLDSEGALRLALQSPSIPRRNRVAILSEVAEKLSLSEIMKGFLGLLLENNRLDALGTIQELYEEMRDEAAGILRGVLYVPAEPSEEQLSEVSRGLEKVTGKKVVLRVRVDPSLIGGARAELGGVVYDGSLKAQLKRLRESLLEG